MNNAPPAQQLQDRPDYLLAPKEGAPYRRRQNVFSDAFSKPTLVAFSGQFSGQSWWTERDQFSPAFFPGFIPAGLEVRYVFRTTGVVEPHVVDGRPGLGGAT